MNTSNPIDHLSGWKQYFDIAVAPSPNHLVILDTNFNIYYTSNIFADYLYEYFGLRAADGINIFETKLTLSKVLKNTHKIRDVINDQSVEYYERFPIPKGFGHIKVAARPFKNSQQEIIGIFITVADLTKYTLLNQTIQKSEATLRAVLNASDDGIYAINERGKIIIANQKAISDFKIAGGYEIQEGIFLNDVIEKERLKRWYEVYYDKVLEGKKLSWKGNVKQQSGQDLFVWNKYSPVYSEDKIIGVVEVSRDITETIKLEEKIKEQLSELDRKNAELNEYIESNLQLENFAYIASHDLKAPLRSLTSFAQLLKSKCFDQLDEKGQQYLDIVIKSSKNMELLINDLLVYSRVNETKKKIQELHLPNLILRIKSELDVVLMNTDASIIEESELPVILGDETMIYQLFSNLISNGIKFQQPGSTPQVTIEHQENDTHWLFKIKDNGIGISETNQSKIFEIFEKLHSSDIYEGTGLGLTICKKIVLLHQGSISVKSTEGEGSEFHFSLKKQPTLKSGNEGT